MMKFVHYQHPHAHHELPIHMLVLSTSYMFPDATLDENIERFVQALTEVRNNPQEIYA